MMKRCVVDVETTGFANSDEIVEIGAIFIDENGIEIDRYSSFIKNEKEMGSNVINVHGITNEILKNERIAKVVLAEFIDKCGDECNFFAHNATFDSRLILVNLLRNALKVPEGWVFHDTVDGSKVFESQVPNRKLATLLEKRGIDPGTAHRAVDDSLSLSKLIKLWIDEKGLQSVERNCSPYRLRSMATVSNDPRFDGGSQDFTFYTPINCLVTDEASMAKKEETLTFLGVFTDSKKEVSYFVRRSDGSVKSYKRNLVKILD